MRSNKPVYPLGGQLPLRSFLILPIGSEGSRGRLLGQWDAALKEFALELSQSLVPLAHAGSVGSGVSRALGPLQVASGAVLMFALAIVREGGVDVPVGNLFRGVKGGDVMEQPTSGKVGVVAPSPTTDFCPH